MSIEQKTNLGFYARFVKWQKKRRYERLGPSISIVNIPAEFNGKKFEEVQNYLEKTYGEGALLSFNDYHWLRTHPKSKQAETIFKYARGHQIPSTESNAWRKFRIFIVFGSQTARYWKGTDRMVRMGLKDDLHVLEPSVTAESFDQNDFQLDLKHDAWNENQHVALIRAP